MNSLIEEIENTYNMKNNHEIYIYILYFIYLYQEKTGQKENLFSSLSIDTDKKLLNDFLIKFDVTINDEQIKKNIKKAINLEFLKGYSSVSITNDGKEHVRKIIEIDNRTLGEKIENFFNRFHKSIAIFISIIALFFSIASFIRTF